MKRYVAFAGENYYACGGIWDYVLDGDDLLFVCYDVLDYMIKGSDDWVHIYDCLEKKVVAGSINQGYGSDRLDKSELKYVFDYCIVDNVWFFMEVHNG